MDANDSSAQPAGADRAAALRQQRGLEVHATLQSELAARPLHPHYRGVVRLEQLLPAHGERAERQFHDDAALTPPRPMANGCSTARASR